MEKTEISKATKHSESMKNKNHSDTINTNGKEIYVMALRLMRIFDAPSVTLKPLILHGFLDALYTPFFADF